MTITGRRINPNAVNMMTVAAAGDTTAFTTAFTTATSLASSGASSSCASSDDSYTNSEGTYEVDDDFPYNGTPSHGTPSGGTRSNDVRSDDVPSDLLDSEKTQASEMASKKRLEEAKVVAGVQVVQVVREVGVPEAAAPATSVRGEEQHQQQQQHQQKGKPGKDVKVHFSMAEDLTPSGKAGRTARSREATREAAVLREKALNTKPASPQFDYQQYVGRERERKREIKRERDHDPTIRSKCGLW